jgi:hypothetical protein
MRKAFPPSKPEQDDLLPEYRFDYRRAKPNRFASKGAETAGLDQSDSSSAQCQKKIESMVTKKVVRSAITGKLVKPTTASHPKTKATETVGASPKKKNK